MIRIAMLSYWHVHAWDYTKDVQNNPNSEVVAVWDEIPARGQEAAAKLGVPFFADLDELLARTDIDAVVVDTPTNIHREVMVKAARAGKHIFTEKVIAPTTKEVSEIIAAVREAGVKLTVSLPRLNDRYTLAAQEVLSQGLLGELTQARVRLSHNGAIANWLPEHFYNLEQCGGGALIDLGPPPDVPDPPLPRSAYERERDVRLRDRQGSRRQRGRDASLRERRDRHRRSGLRQRPLPVQRGNPRHGRLALYGTPDEVVRVRSNKLDAQEWVTIEQPEKRFPPSINGSAMC